MSRGFLAGRRGGAHATAQVPVHPSQRMPDSIVKSCALIMLPNVKCPIYLHGGLGKPPHPKRPFWLKRVWRLNRFISFPFTAPPFIGLRRTKATGTGTRRPVNLARSPLRLCCIAFADVNNSRAAISYPPFASSELSLIGWPHCACSNHAVCRAWNRAFHRSIRGNMEYVTKAGEGRCICSQKSKFTAPKPPEADCRSRSGECSQPFTLPTPD